MRPVRSLAASAVFALAWCLAGRVSADGEPASPRRFTLRSGLEVVLAPDAAEREACVLVRYAVGSRDDPAGHRGLAHLAEHLVLRAGGALEQLEDVGVREMNGVTTPDETYYFAVGSRAAVPRMLWLFASHMAFAAADVDAAGLRREREVVLHEWRERTEGEASVLIAESAAAALYPPPHPYALPLDRPDDVRALGVPDVQWFLQTFYRPANATVTVAGNFDAEAVQTLVERYFAPIPDGRAAPAAARRAVPPSALAGPREISHTRRVAAPSLRWVWPVPGRASAELPALRAVAGLLSDALTGALVAELGAATAAEAFVVPREHESLFEVLVVARSEDVLARLAEQVESLVAALPGDDGRAIERALSAEPAESLVDASALVERAARLALPRPEPAARPLEASDLARVAGKYLRKDRRVTVTMHAETDE